MKTLYLVRHAKSSWKDPSLSDFQRPLNKRGKRDAPVMGSRLAEKKILPDLILSSPASRAMITCNTIADQLGYDLSQIETNRDIYHAGVSTLLQIVQSVDNSVSSLMLFGHNPGFTDFANKLAQTSIFNIPTCGVFGCQFDIEKWSQAELGQARLLFYDYPKNT